MQKKYTYIGCFFDKKEFSETLDSIPGQRLFRLIETPHVTFVYKPEEVDEALFGQEITAQIVGYGNNGQNEGLKVILHCDNEAVTQMINGIPVPHITVSVAKGARSVDTCNLQFEAIDPITIKGRFGAFTVRNRVVCSR